MNKTQAVCLLLLIACASCTQYLARNYESESDAPSNGASVYVNNDFVRVRSGPCTTFQELTIIYRNTVATYTGQGKFYNFFYFFFAVQNGCNLEWWSVRLSDGRTGWIAAMYLAIGRPGTTQQPPQNPPPQQQQGKTCQCTEYISRRTGITSYPNAAQWDNVLRAAGYRSSSTPSVGAIIVQQKCFPGIYGDAGMSQVWCY